MKCQKCDADNTDAARFCSNCATSLTGAEEAQPLPTQTIETPKEELTTGSTFAGRYQIIEELGKGGMGKVYKAVDTEIKEKIALKLVKPEIASDQKTIDRFRNELKVARQISHKNVCRMYDLNKAGGSYFITMEYVPGGDLKRFIRRSQQLSLGTAVSIAKQICEGLAEAHRLGVVHRDLKPNNIMIDDIGNVRIMDFGIARSLETKGLTGKGLIIGTPEYMSPEQAEAKEVDRRSDIYSLGVIIYEMATGTLPFKGETALSIAMKHKGKMPKDPREVNPQISEELSRLILKCMEKEKEGRYQAADEIFSMLDMMGNGTSKTGVTALKTPDTENILEKEWKKSIAVLPFLNLSPENEQEYFCDGLTEEIINALSHIQELRVVARTSVFSFKGKEIDIREVGEKLNVEAVLEGSVRKAGDRLRIMAQLINIDDGCHLWSERYDRKMEDVFAIQDEVTLAIVDNLKVKLLKGEKAQLEKRHTDNLEAYNLHLKSSYYRQMLTGEGFKKSIKCSQKALEMDPNYALAYYGLAAVYLASSYWGNMPPAEAYPKAKEYANTALNIDSTLAEAHAALGFIYTHYDWNWPAAERELRYALDLKPNSAIIHLYYSWLFTLTERHEEAIAEAKKARELDPVSSFVNSYAGQVYIFDGQYDKAIEVLEDTISLSPAFFLPHYFLGLAYEGKLMLEKAAEENEKALNLSGSNPMIVTQYAITCYQLGDKSKAEELFGGLKQRLSNEYIPPMAFFCKYLFIGDLDQAYVWLERAFHAHDTYLAWCRILPNELLPIPDEPRFRELLGKLKMKN